jgi:hypothetical protein
MAPLTQAALDRFVQISRELGPIDWSLTRRGADAYSRALDEAKGLADFSTPVQRPAPSEPVVTPSRARVSVPAEAYEPSPRVKPSVVGAGVNDLFGDIDFEDPFADLVL